MQRKSAILNAVGALLASTLALGFSYFVFFDKPDLVYETDQFDIPLQRGLKLRLIRVKVQNVGHRPSEQFQGAITVWGNILDHEVEALNPSYDNINYSKVTKPGGLRSQIVISDPSLGPGEYPIKISVVYSGFAGEEDVNFTDTRGTARLVPSVAAERDKRSRFFSSAFTLTLLFLGLIAVALILVFAVSGSRKIGIAFVR